MDTDYDPRGNVTQETTHNDGYEDLVKDYAYDNLDRLLSEQRVGTPSSISMTGWATGPTPIRTVLLKAEPLTLTMNTPQSVHLIQPMT